jgi:hypothetical protein
MRPPVSLTLALIMIALPAPLTMAAPAAKDPAKTEIESSGPRLRLTVTPRHGFRPLTFSFSAHLSGVELTDEQYCHAGLEWESRTPGGLVVVSKEDPKCLHPPEQIQVQTTFTKVVTLSTPGVYVYRLILHRRDGEKILSNTQEIRVLDNM